MSVITILRADVPVTKTYSLAGCEPYPKVTWWRVYRRAVVDLDGLASLVVKLSEDQRSCVVRGEPIDDFGQRRVRRLSRGERATIRSANDGLSWLCIDVDGADLRSDSRPELDPVGYAAAARSVLCESLAKARCFFQLSASAGIKPGIYTHLWFWLREPAHDEALRRWARKAAYVDAQLFVSTQPHYVAPPQFNGRPDPCPVRCGWLDGTPTVWPEGLQNLSEWRAARRKGVREAARRREIAQRTFVPPGLLSTRAERALSAAIQRIHEAREGTRNDTVCRAAHHVGGFVGAGALDEEYALGQLDEAAMAVLPASRHETTLRSIRACLSSGATRPHYV